MRHALTLLILTAAPALAGPVPCEVQAQEPAPRQVPRVVTRPDGTRVQVWEVVPPDAPRVTAQAEKPAPFRPLTYAEGCKRAEAGEVLVTFWGVKARPVPGCVVAGMPLNDTIKKPVIGVEAEVLGKRVGYWVVPDCDDHGLQLFADLMRRHQKYDGRLVWADNVPASAPGSPARPPAPVEPPGPYVSFGYLFARSGST